MRRILHIILGAYVLLVMASCSQSRRSNEPQQDILTGGMKVIVDESVIGLMREQLDVFHSSYTGANVELLPYSERVGINALQNGEATVAILKRTLTDGESIAFDQRSIKPNIYPIASDAIVFLGTGQDSSITIDAIRQGMKGDVKTSFHFVFADVNSSTLRSLKEFVSLDKVSATNVKVIDDTQSIIEAIKTDVKGVAVVSLAEYIANKSSFDSVDNIRILGVRNDSDGKYYYPTQSSLYEGRYPLVEVIYVLNYQPSIGLGIGFSAFLTSDRGQRLILKYGVLPRTMPNTDVIIRDNFSY